MLPSEAFAMEINLACAILLLFAGCASARPQDLGTGLLLAAGQMKDLIESGAAARQDKSIEVLGQKMRGGLEFGFGDAIRPSRSRRYLSWQLAPKQTRVVSARADRWQHVLSKINA